MELRRNPHQETRTIWEHGVRCDICKEEIRTRGFERADVDITAAIGDSYPEADFSTHYKLDCCAKCFLDKVKPLIEATFDVEFQEKPADEGSFPFEEVRDG